MLTVKLLSLPIQLVPKLYEGGMNPFQNYAGICLLEQLTDRSWAVTVQIRGTSTDNYRVGSHLYQHIIETNAPDGLIAAQRSALGFVAECARQWFGTSEELLAQATTWEDGRYFRFS